VVLSLSLTNQDAGAGVLPTGAIVLGTAASGTGQPGAIDLHAGTLVNQGIITSAPTSDPAGRNWVIGSLTSSGTFSLAAGTTFYATSFTQAAGGMLSLAVSPGVTPVRAIAGGSRVIRVTLFCPAGGAGCARVTVRATITVRHRPGTVIATRSVALRAGATRRLALRLDGAGRALLGRLARLPATVTVRAGHARLAKATVPVRRPKEKKTPHSRGL
jgi:hypothetical protein